jgi:D-alanyl-D-alanine dipeptidase
MTSSGFLAYPCEWWHYTLEAEPFPDTYFDFVIS